MLLLLFNDILGKLFNATHEVGFPRSKASSSGAISSELVNMEVECGKYYDFDRNLDCLNRSHNHFYVNTEFATTCGVFSPAWKLGDSHLFKGGMAIYSDIGAVSVIVEPNSDFQVKKHIMPRERLPKSGIIKI